LRTRQRIGFTIKKRIAKNSQRILEIDRNFSTDRLAKLSLYFKIWKINGKNESTRNPFKKKISLKENLTPSADFNLPIVMQKSLYIETMAITSF